MNKKHFLLLPLLLCAMVVSAEPIVRVVSTNGLDRAFATDQVRKLALSAEAVDVVNNAGSVLLSVPKTDIARIEFTEGTPTGIDNLSPALPSREGVKVLRDGQLYIMYKGQMYNVQGKKVTTSR
ncbi:MAG: hypothetical protein K6A36_07690 [Paludibacteraceae bacterium]|nr:hypothetical protein [Paludibacteraceae bacterium]